jgi:hypothetical protein
MLALEDECESIQDMGKTIDRLSIRHNRSCLLKERDILMKRGYRPPDNLVFIQ